MSIGDVLLELGGRAMQRTENVQEVLSSESVGNEDRGADLARRESC